MRNHSFQGVSLNVEYGKTFSRRTDEKPSKQWKKAQKKMKKGWFPAEVIMVKPNGKIYTKTVWRKVHGIVAFHFQL